MSGEPAGWEHFAHEADVGVRGYGPTRAAAFEQGAMALMHAIADPDRIEPRDMVEIACDAPDDALLFVDWLNALIFEVATRGMLFCRFEVRLDGRRLAGRAWGEPIDPMRHRGATSSRGNLRDCLSAGPYPAAWGWPATMSSTPIAPLLHGDAYRCFIAVTMALWE